MGTIRNPGQPDLLPDNPFGSAQPMAGIGEMALVTGQQAVYCNRVRWFDDDTPMLPREQYFTAGTATVFWERMCAFSLAAPAAFVEFDFWSEGGGVILQFTAKTYTVANPPVLIATGETVETADFIFAPGGGFGFNVVVPVPVETGSAQEQIVRVEGAIMTAQRQRLWITRSMFYEATRLTVDA